MNRRSQNLNIGLWRRVIVKRTGLSLFLGTLLLISFCGRRTAPKPMAEITKSLPLLLATNTFYREDKLHIRWKLPKELLKKQDSSSQIPVQFYQIDFKGPSGRCGNCNPQDLGYISYDPTHQDLNSEMKSTGQMKLLSRQIRYHEGTFYLVLSPDNLPTSLFSFTLHYRTSDGRLSGKSIEHHPRRPAGIPVPRILKVVQFKEFTHIRWEKVEELVRIRFNGEGKQLQMIGYFGVNFYKENEAGEWRLLNTTPYRGDRIDLKVIESPIFARSVDRFNNESVAVEVKVKKPVDL
ncbi:MAG: hypothetical protein GY786_11650 [Proteobacteria bacterium]|nr:hypothetical protein [Pseudomonadota bacterium]